MKLLPMFRLRCSAEIGRTFRKGNVMNDCERIVAYCREHGSITQMEATRELGNTRLGARIWDLKNKFGYEVEDIWETSTDRFGDPTRYKRYFVKDKTQ